MLKIHPLNQDMQRPTANPQLELFSETENTIIEWVKRSIREISYPNKNLLQYFEEILEIFKSVQSRIISHVGKNDTASLEISIDKDQDEKPVILTMRRKTGRLKLLRALAKETSNSIFLTPSAYALEGSKYCAYRPASNENIHKFLNDFHNRLLEATPQDNQ